MLELAEPTGPTQPRQAAPAAPANPAAPAAPADPAAPANPAAPAAWSVLPSPITAVLRRECLASVAEIRAAIQHEVAEYTRPGPRWYGHIRDDSAESARPRR